MHEFHHPPARIFFNYLASIFFSFAWSLTFRHWQLRPLRVRVLGPPPQAALAKVWKTIFIIALKILRNWYFKNLWVSVAVWCSRRPPSRPSVPSTGTWGSAASPSFEDLNISRVWRIIFAGMRVYLYEPWDLLEHVVALHVGHVEKVRVAQHACVCCRKRKQYFESFFGRQSGWKRPQFPQKNHFT